MHDEQARGNVPADAREFLKAHELAVLSTSDHSGEVHAAVVNYFLDDDDCIYVLTKSETTKTHDMLGNHHVAVTVYDAVELSTVQIQATAEIEASPDQKNRIFKEIARPRDYGGDVLLPPATHLSAGGFIIFRISPTTTKYRKFKDDKHTWICFITKLSPNHLYT